jgi:protein SHQ1
LTLISILFAFAYDSRTTQDDPTTESAWTICTLIPAFSALDPPPYVPTPHLADAINAVMVASYRRSFVFPLYRSFALAERCRQDVADILSGGKRHVTRALFKIKHILDHHDVYYVYSKIWVDDFCVWIQSNASYVITGLSPHKSCSCSYFSDETLRQVAKILSEINVAKSSIGWDLEALEDAVIERLESSDGSDSDQQ